MFSGSTCVLNKTCFGAEEHLTGECPQVQSCSHQMSCFILHPARNEMILRASRPAHYDTKDQKMFLRTELILKPKVLTAPFVPTQMFLHSS